MKQTRWLEVGSWNLEFWRLNIKIQLLSSATWPEIEFTFTTTVPLADTWPGHPCFTKSWPHWSPPLHGTAEECQSAPVFFPATVL